MVLDTEKASGQVAPFAGLNVKNGDQITLTMTLQSKDLTSTPEDCHVLLESKRVLEIMSAYIRVAD